MKLVGTSLRRGSSPLSLRYGGAALLLAVGVLSGCSANLAGDNRDEVCVSAESLLASLQNLTSGNGELEDNAIRAVARAQDLKATIDNAAEAESAHVEAVLDEFLDQASPAILARAGAPFSLPTDTAIPLPTPTETAQAPSDEDLNRVRDAAEPLEQRVQSGIDRLNC